MRRALLKSVLRLFVGLIASYTATEDGGFFKLAI